VFLWLSCPTVLSGRSVHAVLSWLPCSVCPLLAVLSWQSCLAILSWRTCSGDPSLTVLSRPSYLVVAVPLSVWCSGCPLPAA
jgi:hypothetical protein